MAPQFVVTPWRDANELLAVRLHLYSDSLDEREKAVNKVHAWRARKFELPLLLESTADIAEATLRDEDQTLASHTLRLTYATAIARFVTGVLDTQTDLARLSSLSQTPPQIPVSLRETRHRIVHRHLPSLAELQRAAKESLEWLWEHYWSHLNALLAPAASARQLDEREVKERLQGMLKNYVKERKTEIKNRGKEARAADNAVGSCLAIGAPRDVKNSSLVDLLVPEKNILPVGKKLGSSMEGAYLIWAPFIMALGTVDPLFTEALIESMVDILSAPRNDAGSVEDDPVREGMCAWVVKLLDQTKDRVRRGQLSDHALSMCLTTPTFWTLKLADSILKDPSAPGRTSWLAVLEAARLDAEDEAQEPQAEEADQMELDAIEAGSLVEQAIGIGEKIRGPQKYPGLWRPRPIGWIPPGWSEDD
ncbi:rRNA-processing protein las1 [Paraconiothyrium brasiliense]|uniref:rRNA-processing protein las1 n=1 Tax=Paraconiothyrium brasiliense TaxID=300254 RepID=A0ABR3RL01_9PLEO